MKSISILKRFDGEVVSTSSTVRKRDGRIEKKTKNALNFFAPGGAHFSSELFV